MPNKKGGKPEDAGIPDKDELTKRIEVLMGPSADEAPPTSTSAQDRDEPATAPELSAEAVPDKAATGIQESEPADAAVAETQQTTTGDTQAEPEPTEADVATEAQPEAAPVAEDGADTTPATPEEPAGDPADKLVDDIVAEESDQLLAAEDDKRAAAVVPPKAGLKERLQTFIAALWHNPFARKAALAGAVIVVVSLVALPPSRYFLMNSAGVRVKASLTVLDDSTQQPLKNVQVRLGGQTAQTDGEGKVQLERLRLGPAEMVVEKRAFAPLTRKVTMGLGSNPLGEFKITPVGSQYAFIVSDYLSGKPVTNAEASSGEANATADDEGKVVLTTDVGDEVNELKVTIRSESYRDEELTINLNDKNQHTVKMVSARKHAFISKRSGKYDVYKIDVDGKNEQMVLSGTGSEREDMILVPHPADDIVALVSTRDNIRNRDGFLLSTLTLLELDKDGGTSKVTQSERIQVVDWIGGRLVYVQIAAGTSAGNPQRHRMMSYDYKNAASKELASSNYFNDVMTVGGQIYYAPSSAHQTGKVSFNRVNPDGSNQQVVLDKEVWNVFRTEYDKLSLSVQEEWYDYRPGAAKPDKAGGPPALLRTRIYVDSPDKQRSLWVDDRDGKGVLLAYNAGDKSDKALKSQSGLKYPVRWLSNHAVIYRIHTDQETADYAMSLEGGDPVKIRDVTNTGGVDQWFYY